MEKARKIAIIEPHYDDAWINLGGYILQNPDKQFKIISVSYDEWNLHDSTAELQKILPNITTRALKLKGVHLLLKERLSEEQCKEHFLAMNRLRSMDQVTEKIDEECDGYDLALIPLGTDHPQHRILKGIKLKIPTKMYAEFPYFYEKDRQEHSKMKRILIDIKDKKKMKLDIFSEVYPTQRHILDILTSRGLMLQDLEHELVLSDVPQEPSPEDRQ